MTLEYSRRQSQVAEKIKAWISKITGFQDHKLLQESVDPDNAIATHHPFEKQAMWVYESVDNAISFGERVGIIKK